MRPGPVYEMLWDCPYCGQTGLLGLTQRHCPGCGAPQDPARRYFPAEADKVAVEGHRYVGADLVCASCGAPSAASARHCGRCGAPLGDDDAPVERVASAPALGSAPAHAPRAGRRAWSRRRRIVLTGLVVVALAGALAALTWERERLAVVAGHTWQRAIAIERFETLDAAGWCDALPGDARVVAEETRQRGTRRIPDGQHCTTRNVDDGDGTFRQVQDCQTRYREEPVYDQHCTFRVDRWTHLRDVTARGTGRTPAPHWPAAEADGCAVLGCTRLGERSERYELTLALADAGTVRCALARSRWNDAPEGSRWRVPIGVLTGRPDCAAMRPAS